MRSVSYMGFSVGMRKRKGKRQSDVSAQGVKSDWNVTSIVHIYNQTDVHKHTAGVCTSRIG